jgi:hypothetical protein
MTMKFELHRLARDYSNEEIIAEIQRVDSLINKKYLTYDDFNRISKINALSTAPAHRVRRLPIELILRLRSG